jgi:hypothetical protein
MTDHQEKVADAAIKGELREHGDDTVPMIGERWRHYKGSIYTVVLVTNQRAVRDKDEFPVTVCYRDPDGQHWSRPLASFKDKFVRV